MKRRPAVAAAELEQRNLDAETERAISAGLGIRPVGWWRQHRPDLADENGEAFDLYGHLAGGPDYARPKEHARQRFAHLVANDLLTTAELASIALGEGPRYEWRRAVLGRRNGVHE